MLDKSFETILNRLDESWSPSGILHILQNVLGIYKEEDENLSDKEVVKKFKPILHKIYRDGGTRDPYSTHKLLNLFSYLCGNNGNIRNLQPNIIPGFIFVLLTEGTILTGTTTQNLVMYHINKIKTTFKNIIFGKSFDSSDIDQLNNLLQPLKPNKTSYIVKINKAGAYNCKGIALVTSGKGVNSEKLLEQISSVLNITFDKKGSTPKYEGVRGFDIEPITVNIEYSDIERSRAEDAYDNIDILDNSSEEDDANEKTPDSKKDNNEEDDIDEIVEIIKLARKYKKVHSRSRKQKIVDQAQEYIDELNDVDNEGGEELSISDVRAIAYGESEEDELADDKYTLKKDNDEDTKTWNIIERVFYGITKADNEKVEDLADSDPKDINQDLKNIDINLEDKDNISKLLPNLANYIIERDSDDLIKVQDYASDLSSDTKLLLLSILQQFGLLNQIQGNTNVQKALGIENSNQIKLLVDFSKEVRNVKNIYLALENQDDIDQNNLNKLPLEIYSTLTNILKELRKEGSIEKDASNAEKIETIISYIKPTIDEICSNKRQRKYVISVIEKIIEKVISKKDKDANVKKLLKPKEILNIENISSKNKLSKDRDNAEDIDYNVVD